MGEDGRPRGFAHVEFETHEMAKEAMKLAGKNLDGREVRLDLSQSKKREGGFGGGRGGGFGGGRGGGRFVIISYLICTLALITAVQSIFQLDPFGPEPQYGQPDAFGYND